MSLLSKTLLKAPFISIISRVVLRPLFRAALTSYIRQVIRSITDYNKRALNY
jgi:hypothetical protein